MSRTTWFENGLQFECISCGDCCKTHGEYAFVYLSAEDVNRISAYLNMPRIDFLNTFCAVDADGDIHLKDLSGDCSFLEFGNCCRVYPVRPKQCETWPFWSENLKKTTWEGPVCACCPGIGHGRLYTKQDIERIAKDRDRWYRE
jgi:Fe-S-cluster containining protein